MPARTNMHLNLCLPKPLPCQQPNEMYLKMSWPIPSHDSEDTKCTHHVLNILFMPVKTQNLSHHSLNKPLPCQRGQKMNLIMTNSPYASEGHNISHILLTKQRGHKIYLNQAPPMPARTIFISTCYERTNPMPSRTQNISQPILSDTGEAQNVFHYMVTKQILLKINLNKC